jgi:aminopeptidase-like protein
LPITTVMGSKCGEHSYYHTSMDNWSFVTPEKIGREYHALKQSIEIIKNLYLKTNVLCELQFGKRGLCLAVIMKGLDVNSRNLMNFYYIVAGNMLFWISLI